MARRRGDVIWRAVDDQVVGLDLQSSRYFSLNPSAAMLWDLLEQEMTAAELAEALTSYYGVEPEAAKKDVEALLAEMARSGLLLD